MKQKMTTKQLTAEVAGWYGTFAILTAYILVSFNVITGDGLTFQLLNLTGAIGIIAIAAYKGLTQSIVLNVFWGIIAVVAIVNIYV